MKWRRALPAVVAELREWVDAAFSWIPGRIGFTLRAAYMRRRFAALGVSPVFDVAADVAGAENIVIGDHFNLSRYSSLRAVNGHIRIGHRVAVNQNVRIHASEAGGMITIGDDVMIGSNTVIRASGLSHFLREPVYVPEGVESKAMLRRRARR